MTLVEKVRALEGRDYAGIDNRMGKLQWLPPVPPDEIAALEEAIPCALPDEIRELLETSAGFEDGPLQFVSFGHPGNGFGLEDVFPQAWTIAGDGWGNFWVVDLMPNSSTWGPVYFACHDAPVVVYQCADLEGFIDGIAEYCAPPYKGALEMVRNDATSRIWSKNPGMIEHADALVAGDEHVRAFAQTLDESWQIIDLRGAKTGDGFSWGRYGAETKNLRFGELPVFAYQKRKGLLQRLRGK